MKKKSKSRSLPPPKRSSQLPATLGALGKVRAELKSDITSVKLEVKSVRAEVKSVRAEVKSVRAEVKSVRAEVKSVRADLESVRADLESVRSEVKSLEIKMESRFEELKSTNHRMLALLEEQSIHTKAALDGYAVVYEGQQRLEQRIGKVEKFQLEMSKWMKQKDV